MQKIPTIYRRDPDDMKRVLDGEWTPGCEWVLGSEAVATRKYDGTCVMYDGARWWARREVKPGKTAPAGFEAVSTDEATGKTVGWEPIEQSGFAKWHADALCAEGPEPTPDFPVGTYELVGPKINGNPENYDHHELVPHGAVPLRNGDPVALISYCAQEGYEGIVWHHPDGRMAKLKVRDYPDMAPLGRKDSA